MKFLFLSQQSNYSLCVILGTDQVQWIHLVKCIILYTGQTHSLFLLLIHSLVYTVYAILYCTIYCTHSCRCLHLQTHMVKAAHTVTVRNNEGRLFHVLGSSSHWPGRVVHYGREDFECSRLLFWLSGKMLAVQQSTGSTQPLNEQNSDSTITHSLAKWWSGCISERRVTWLCCYQKQAADVLASFLLQSCLIDSLHPSLHTFTNSVFSLTSSLPVIGLFNH